MPTLDLRNSTLQELFDGAVNGLRGQKYKQAAEGGVCKYRAGEGLKCAVGHLIPDENYEPDWDKIGGINSVVAAGKILVYQEQNRLLIALQDVHDDADEDSGNMAGQMEKGFEEVAKTFNLVYTPPEEKK